MVAFATIATFQDMVLANIVRGSLESEGIDAWVLDETAALGNDGGVLAAQGIRVQVRSGDAEEAVAFLRGIEEQIAEANRDE
jgi:hypothetical protein